MLQYCFLLYVVTLAHIGVDMVTLNGAVMGQVLRELNCVYCFCEITYTTDNLFISLSLFSLYLSLPLQFDSQEMCTEK